MTEHYWHSLYQAERERAEAAEAKAEALREVLRQVASRAHAALASTGGDDD